MSRRLLLVRLAVAVALLGADAAGSATQRPIPVTSLLALGDSVPSGATCTCENEVSLLGLRLSEAERTPVRVINAAQGGETSQDLLDQIHRDAIVAEVGRLITITVGANDFDEAVVASPACNQALCYTQQLHELGERIQASLAALLVNHPRTPAWTSSVIVTGYWNVFKDGAVGRSRGADYVRNSDSLTRSVNQVLQSAAARAGVRYAGLYAPFKGDGERDDTPLLGPDGDHPNADGHRVVATAVQQALNGPRLAPRAARAHT